jgi:hypothetical protein
MEHPKELQARKERLLIAINDNLEDATAIIIQSITDAIMIFYNKRVKMHATK